MNKERSEKHDSPVSAVFLWWRFEGVCPMAAVEGVNGRLRLLFLSPPSLLLSHLATVHDIVTRGGRCLIPVFALGRAQELLLILGQFVCVCVWWWGGGGEEKGDIRCLSVCLHMCVYPSVQHLSCTCSAEI